MKSYTRYLQDIRFWIGLNFLIRLIGITNPPYESGAWRQVITAMVTKNLVFGEFNLLYPKMDYFFIAMETTSGISPMEFPLFNALGAIVSLLFGWHDWHLRLVNLIISSLGIWYFYLLIKRYFSERIGFFSGFLLLQSIWWAYSRKIMPDTFSVSLCLIALYYAFQFFSETNRKKEIVSYLLFLLCGTGGMLSKIPSSYLFSVMIFPLLDKKIELKKKIIFILGAVPSLAAVYWWYFIWSPELVIKFNNRMFFMGKGLIEGWLEIKPYCVGLLEHFYKFAFSYSGFALCLLALYFLVKNKDRLMFRLMLLLSLSFAVFILKSGYNFVHHSYYIIPFVPVMSLLAGYGLDKLSNVNSGTKWVFVLLIIYGVDNFFRHQHDLRIPKRDHYRLSIAPVINQYIPKDELIATNGGASPVDIYNFERRGYSLEENELTESNLNILKQRGIKYFVLNRHGSQKVFSAKLLFQNDDIAIYHLQ